LTELAHYLQPDSRHVARLVAVVCVAATLALAWQAARLTWTLWPRPDMPAAPPQPVRPGGAGSVSHETGIDANALANRHLFGQADRAAPAPAPADAPETSLSLELSGIYYSTVPEHSRAMIEGGSADDTLYSVGDELPGGARIEGIYPSKVILKRRGHHEALTLKQDDLGELSGQAPPDDVDGGSPPAEDAAATLSRYREDILRNPGRIQQLLQPVPVQDDSGNLVGFRVHPGSDPALFKATGLQSGDLVKAIGGVPLTSRDSALQALQRIGKADRLTLTVQRDGVQQQVVLDFRQ